MSNTNSFNAMTTMISSKFDRINERLVNLETNKQTNDLMDRVNYLINNVNLSSVKQIVSSNNFRETS